MHYDCVVLLSCFGNRYNDFILCGGVENIILKVHPALTNYKELMDYFDRNRLFDRPMLELQSIRHFIYNIGTKYDEVIRPIWTPKEFELYQRFLQDHKSCGVNVRLLPPELVDLPEPQSEITHHKNFEQPAKLRLILNK